MDLIGAVGRAQLVGGLADRAGGVSSWLWPRPVSVSNKHTLALVNRGGASTAELLALARELRDGVRDRPGIELRPEPTLVGVEL